MEFLSGLLMILSGWFGFNTTPDEVVVEPQVVVADTTTTTQLEGAPEDITAMTNSVASESAPAEVAQVEVESDSAMVATSEPVALSADIRTMMVAGGCFWCVEADLEKTPGVLEVVSGYAGGSLENPTYKTYKAAGHREVVEVTYDANQISFEDILIVTLKTTDPTDDDGTFADRGDGYSAAFFYETAAQKTIIDSLIAEVDQYGPYADPLAIDVEERPQFWMAEDYHQDYYKGTLTQLRYQFYRNASGRTDFIKRHWGEDTSPNLPWRNQSSSNTTTMNNNTYPWSNYQKPDKETLRATIDATAFRVTQEDGTERAGTSPLDKIYEPGIYVDILSGEPLFSSRDKFDSGTGWPSFVAPITPSAVTAHEDRRLFSVRTETRSAIADNHLGHVFPDGPVDRGGLRYCMNGVALRFVPEVDMTAEGYGDFLKFL